MERDIVNRVRTLTTPDGGQLTAAFKPEGLLASQTTPDGGEESYVYTSAGRLAEVADGSSISALPLRRRRPDRRDSTPAPAGGRSTSTSPGASSAGCPRPGASSATATTSSATSRSLEAAVETWRFEYDDAGRLTRSVDPDRLRGALRVRPRRSLGRVGGLAGRRVRYGYDVRGRIAAMTDADGGAVRYEHNAVSQLTSITDQLGRQTIVTYDAAGRHLADDVPRPAADGARLPRRPDVDADAPALIVDDAAPSDAARRAPTGR